MFSRNKKAQQVEDIMCGILDAQDADIFVARNCNVLFMNAAAQDRVDAAMKPTGECKKGYAALFPGLCEKCAADEQRIPADNVCFELEDVNGKVFCASCATIDWYDNMQARVMSLRDVHEERTAKKKLHKLAYIDQLTGIPNRQRFKEDFEDIREDIATELTCGVVALFDLDNFKLINDTYGHNTGDVLLRRITEHINGMNGFKERLYRLGGDEFVLFYHDAMSKYPTLEAIQEHYSELFKQAFLAYSMPNIEKSCTLSMGAAFFPWHGDNSSELLRKADIALYRAKEGGRNQLFLFEDKYDTAQKFKDLYINIQPILIKSGRTFGYELIDRGEDGDGGEDSINLHEFDRTLDALGLGDIENDARYFISYTEQLMGDTVVKNLPKNKFIVQFHADDARIPGDMARYKALKAKGYSLALTGVKSDTPEELIEISDFCKFGQNALSVDAQKSFIEAHPKKIFIATGVDGAMQFNAAVNAGFKLFQGYFFNQPVVEHKTKDIDPLKVNYFRLLKLASADGYVDFQEISNIISSDVALSYKLLKLLNSAALGLRSKVSSISIAVAYLGEESLKKWIAMLALRGIGEDKPLELVRISLIRAQFGELLAPHFTPRRDAKHVFLVGLLSLLHIALEKSKEDLFKELPVADDIRESILTKSGPYSDMINFFSNYEYSNWDEVTRFAQDHQMSSQLINDSYIAAVKWYNDLANTGE